MLQIRPMTSNDWSSVQRIFQEGIDTGLASLETEVGTYDDYNQRYMQTCRYVALKDGKIAGWVAMYPYSSRLVYRGVAKTSVYIGSEFRGQRIGEKLLQHLIISSEQANFWSLQAYVFPENVASIRLHEKLGFRQVGYFERIGERKGRWYDTVILERRSKEIHGK